MISLSAGLYFVGVPIGSARDITLRALDVLASADILVAEDTRSLRKLLDIHGVALQGRRIRSLHDHSKSNVIETLLTEIEQGSSVAYASEAGMPMIADPGFELGRAAGARGVLVTCAPGPSAVDTALVLAGLPTDAFHFSGFLPAAATARQTALSLLKQTQATLVFYESPKRLGAMLSDAAMILGGDRQAAVARELTKKFEEVRPGTLEELAQAYQQKSPKGEIVVLIDRESSEKVSEADIEKDLMAALAGNSMRDAVDLVSKARNMQRREIYKMALRLSKGSEG